MKKLAAPIFAVVVAVLALFASPAYAVRVAVAKSTASTSGGEITLTAADAGNHYFVPPGQFYILVAYNAGIADRTLTFITPGTVEGLAIADRIVTIPAGKYIAIPPLSTNFISTSTGQVTFDVDATTSLSFGIVTISQ